MKRHQAFGVAEEVHTLCERVTMLPMSWFIQGALVIYEFIASKLQ